MIVAFYRVLHTYCIMIMNIISPTVDQFMDVETRSAVGTLRPLLCQPASDAHVAAELGAVGTQVSIAQLLHADEAPEHLGQTLH